MTYIMGIIAGLKWAAKHGLPTESGAAYDRIMTEVARLEAPCHRGKGTGATSVSRYPNGNLAGYEACQDCKDRR